MNSPQNFIFNGQLCDDDPLWLREDWRAPCDFQFRMDTTNIFGLYNEPTRTDTSLTTDAAFLNAYPVSYLDNTRDRQGPMQSLHWKSTTASSFTHQDQLHTQPPVFHGVRVQDQSNICWPEEGWESNASMYPLWHGHSGRDAPGHAFDASNAPGRIPSGEPGFAALPHPPLLVPSQIHTRKTTKTTKHPTKLAVPFTYIARSPVTHDHITPARKRTLRAIRSEVDPLGELVCRLHLQQSGASNGMCGHVCADARALKLHLTSDHMIPNSKNNNLHTVCPWVLEDINYEGARHISEDDVCYKELIGSGQLIRHIVEVHGGRKRLEGTKNLKRADRAPVQTCIMVRAMRVANAHVNEEERARPLPHRKRQAVKKILGVGTWVLVTDVAGLISSYH